MLKVLKFSGDESKFFGISDLHYNHNTNHWANPLHKQRGFETLEEHNETLIKRWNETCDEESIVFHLGDLIFNDSTGENFWKLVNRLRYKELHFFVGNHISGHLAAYKECIKSIFPDSIDGNGKLNYEVYPLSWDIYAGKRIIFMPTYAEIQINSTLITCCHYPLLSHNKMSHHSHMWSGHCHSHLELTNKDTGKGMRIDLGVESFGRPVSLKEIKYHLRNRDIDSRDHHGS